MAFILFFGTVILLASLTRNRLFLHLLIIGCALFMSMRGLKTPDTAAYLAWFEEPPILNPHVEQGFAWLCYFFNAAGSSFQFFLFVIAFVEMEIWLYCTTKLFPKANYNLMFALCLVFYGIYFWGCVLRASIAITIGYIAMTALLSSNGNKIKELIYYYILILAASAFHASALIYLICPLLNFTIGKKLGAIMVTGSIVLAIMLDKLGLSTYMELVIGSVEDMSRFQNYIIKESDTSLISLFWIISLIICCWIIFRYKYIIDVAKGGMITRFFCNLYIIGFLLLTITNRIPAGARLGMMFTFFEFIIIYKIANSYKHQTEKITIYGVYIFLRFSYMIHSFPLFLNY